MKFKKALLAASLLAVSATTLAGPITGGFEFSTEAVAVDRTDDNTVNYEGFDFADNSAYINVANSFGAGLTDHGDADGEFDTDASLTVISDLITGTFASDFNLNAGKVLFVKDIDINNPTANNSMLSLTVDNGTGLVGTLLFDAVSASATDVSSSTLFDVTVTGLFSFEAAANGCSDIRCAGFYEATEATWNIAANGSNNVSAAAAVPEPASVALLGLGLLGLGFARRKQA